VVVTFVISLVTVMVGININRLVIQELCKYYFNN
jgi:hypothetical protein